MGKELTTSLNKDEKRLVEHNVWKLAFSDPKRLGLVSESEGIEIEESESSSEYEDINSYDRSKLPFDMVKGRPLSCVTREEWGARPVENITLRTSWPIMTMVLDMSCMSANIDRCYNKEDCILRVRDLQRYYMDVIGLPDIPYNFLVSHDGTVFEARGWYVQPSPTINSYPLNREARMDIAYIGDYKDTTYPTETTGAVLELMTKGIDMGLVDSFYDAMDHRDGVPDEF
ncbi:peptidoglycan recognition protein 1-like [Macrosteles quadrilineatus]|uniref:peptidoglycan recognition protein 1-like n=1 Tax=Macrosteles quadrilineatus TaxID=74068 RepID=UPI0023E29A64|nr:peptidoglycan recognition protein 1-like [Macrosteles quadrilineatus]